jgi:carotenoid cleavage dioxygenase-like enzyme
MMPDYAPLLERAFDHVPEEGTYRITDVEGEIPHWLRGSWYVNGPARFARNGLRYRHWLDGDGMVCALHFSPGAIEFHGQFVRCAKYDAEDRAGKAIFRTFGTAFEGDQLKRGIALESPVNVSAYPFAGRLLAFGEQGLPWVLDAETLTTRGMENFQGGLNDLSPFSAHPKIDPNTGEMFNFGVAFGAAEPALNLYRFAPAGHLLSRKRVRLDYACSLHDFALTPRFAVFYTGPYILDMARLRSGATLLESLEWRPDTPAALLVVDRNSGETVHSVRLVPGYALHLIDAFDDELTLTVDLLLLDRPVYDEYQPVPDLFRSVARGRPVRITLDLRSGEVIRRVALAYDLAPDFPNVDRRRFGHDAREFWMLGVSRAGRPGRKFFDHLVHAEWKRDCVNDVWQAPPGLYLGSEPVFVGDPHNDTRGVVMVHLFDAAGRSSSIALFDAGRVALGPRAMVRLAAPFHLAFHGCFAPAC